MTTPESSDAKEAVEINALIKRYLNMTISFYGTLYGAVVEAILKDEPS
jgi:hypothetical protein